MESGNSRDGVGLFSFQLRLSVNSFTSTSQTQNLPFPFFHCDQFCKRKYAEQSRTVAQPVKTLNCDQKVGRSMLNCRYWAWRRYKSLQKILNAIL